LTAGQSGKALYVEHIFDTDQGPIQWWTPSFIRIARLQQSSFAAQTLEASRFGQEG
jgi:hypothetical protein